MIENEIMLPGSDVAQPVDPQLNELSGIVQQVMQPVIAAFAQMIQQSVEANERMAQMMRVQNDRLEALERQVRLQTPCTPQMVKHLNEAIRAAARAALDGREMNDERRCITAVSAIIRKDVYARYGVGSLAEIPRHEYHVALTQVSSWRNALAVRDVLRKDRERSGGRDNV